MMPRLGGHAVAEALELHGTRWVFTVPGNSVLATLDGLRDRDSIEVVSCRHEGGAAFMAEAVGRLSGEPGVCLVTRGPGAANASIGVLTAREEGTPLVLLVGDVANGAVGRNAFQEIDTVSVLKPLAKWATRVPTPDRIPELLSRAFHAATSGRPGPVVLALPEDVQLGSTEAELGECYRRSQARASASDLERVAALLAQAERPLLILGGSGWSETACRDIRSFAERFQLPVSVTFRREDLFDNDHPHYAGSLGVATNPALVARVREADLLLVVGGELGEVETAGYRLLSIPRPAQKLVHVAPSAEELGRIYQPDLGVVSSVDSFAAGVLALPPSERASDEVASAREELERFSVPRDSGDDLSFGRSVQELAGLVAEDAVITLGAGNYTHWPLRYYRFRRPKTLLAPIGAPMGYSVPAAIAAALLQPKRDVVAFAGDGCFLMNGQELATAVQYRARISFIVVNNDRLASVRMRQERLFPGRPVATDLENPSFPDLARAFRVPAARVVRGDDFAATFRRLRASNDGPILIELRTNPDTISPDATLSELRAAARDD